MKRRFLVIFSALLIFSVFGQNRTSDAGFKVYEDRDRTANEGYASEDFRRGVQAYYRGSFNDSIVQFEKALSYMPNDNLILEWLGKAYYKSGMEGNAISYWQFANDNGYGGLLLQNKIEIIKERRVSDDSTDKLVKLSEAGSFPGIFQENMVFSGPVSVLPNSDGTMWLVAYNSNQLLLMNQNGKVIDRITGPLNGFDRPSDILRLKNGNLLIAENAGDRVSILDKNGHFISYLCEKGIDEGKVVGPLYLAGDDYGRIYVTDYGNRRVDVFDGEGVSLFNFGKKQNDFEGLKGPTGICVLNDRVYVADDYYGTVFEFDLSGNFLRDLLESKTLKKPEAIKIWNGSLVICDQNKIIGIDADSGATFEYARTGNAPSRVTTAAPDVNGNVVVSDYSANEVYVMSKVSELVGGLFVQIERIDASSFPNVSVEIKVENRHRQPVVGLQAENFYISENKTPVSDVKFLGAASNNTEADLTLIIDRSNNSFSYKQEMETCVKEIAESMHDKGTLRIVSAGAVPVTEYSGAPSGVKDFSLEALKNPVSNDVPLDLAIRLSCNDLINAEKKRAIIFICSGSFNRISFEKYNLSEITSYLNNNCIAFSAVQVSQNALSDELQYITDNTPGNNYYVFRPEGLKNVASDFIDLPQGIYQFSFTSAMQTNFGQKYLPLEAEVYLLNKSGRDETGYFSPLE